jgi:hypothetical protein
MATYRKAYLAAAPHLCHPEFNPQVVYLVLDDETGDVPTPPKRVEVDPQQAQIEALQEQLAALIASKK